jgi:predicted porin
MLNNKVIRLAVPLTLLACSSAVLAQTATIYGVLDVGVEYIQNVANTQVPTPSGPSTTITRVPTNSNSAPSRLGVKGSADIGDGMSVVYTAEMGMDPGTGNMGQGSRLFGRQVFAGLSSPYGTVSIGRQYTMTFWAGLDADIHGGGIYGTGGLDSYLPNARSDNSLVWMQRTNGFTLGANYSFGRDYATATPTNPAATNCAGEGTDATACRQYSVLAKYDTKTWGVAYALDRMTGNGTGVTFGNLNGGMADTRTIVNGWGKLGDLKIGGGLVGRTNDATAAAAQGAKSNLWHIGVSKPVSEKWTLSAQYLVLQYESNDAYNATLAAVRGTYDLTKGAIAFVQVGNINNNSASTLSVSGGAPLSSPTAGGSQQGMNVGFRYTF